MLSAFGRCAAGFCGRSKSAARNPYQNLPVEAFWRSAIAERSLFGIGHLYQGVDSAIGTGIQAVLFILIYLRKRNTLEAVVAHAVYDIIGITIAYMIY